MFVSLRPLGTLKCIIALKHINYLHPSLKKKEAIFLDSYSKLHEDHSDDAYIDRSIYHWYKSQVIK